MLSEKSYLQENSLQKELLISKIKFAAQHGNLLDMKCSIQKCAKIDENDYVWWEALELAAKNKHFSCFDYLIKTCEAFSNEYKKFACRIAAENNHVSYQGKGEQIKLIAKNDQLSCVDDLIEKYGLMISNKDKWAAVTSAADNDDIEVMRRLMRDLGFSEEALEKAAEEVSVELNQALAPPLLFSKSLSLLPEEKAENGKEIPYKPPPQVKLS